MIYFDNAATTLPKSKGALRAYKKAFQSCGNASRGGHPFAARASEHLYLCRERLAERFGTEPERVVLTMNATHAINLAVKGLIREGDVLISDLEHNAVYRPLYALEKQGRIRIRVFHADLDDDEATVRRFRAALDENVRACVVTHASNICGRVLPLAALSEAARQAGVPLICDASQTAGHFDLQLRELPGVTALCMPGHKGLYGPLGTGALLVSPFFGGSFETLLEGGSGSFSADPEMPALLPERLEAGTMNAPAFAGLAAAVAEKSASGKKEEQIFSYLLSGLRETEGVTLYGAPGAAGLPYCPILLFNIDGRDSEEVAAALADTDVCVRAGLHCSPLAHRALGTPLGGAVRISLSKHNTFGEAERFLAILARKKAR